MVNRLLQPSLEHMFSKARDHLGRVLPSVLIEHFDILWKQNKIVWPSLNVIFVNDDQ